jgi:hypothetical protein
MKELEIINYGNSFAASRPDRFTHGTHCIGGSIDKNGVYPTTQLLPGVARVSIKSEGNKKFNYGKCIAASRPDRVFADTHWKVGLNDENGVYPTIKLLPGVARVSIKNEGIREIYYGNCISASRPDRITVGTPW